MAYLEPCWLLCKHRHSEFMFRMEVSQRWESVPGSRAQCSVIITLGSNIKKCVSGLDWIGKLANPI